MKFGKTATNAFAASSGAPIPADLVDTQAPSESEARHSNELLSADITIQNLRTQRDALHNVIDVFLERHGTSMANDPAVNGLVTALRTSTEIKQAE